MLSESCVHIVEVLGPLPPPGKPGAPEMDEDGGTRRTSAWSLGWTGSEPKEGVRTGQEDRQKLEGYICARTCASMYVSTCAHVCKHVCVCACVCKHLYEYVCVQECM